MGVTKALEGVREICFKYISNKHSLKKAIVI